MLEIFANQFESKAETAHKICGLAQKWQIRDWMGSPTLWYQGNVDGPWSPLSSTDHPGRRAVASLQNLPR